MNQRETHIANTIGCTTAGGIPCSLSDLFMVHSLRSSKADTEKIERSDVNGAYYSRIVARVAQF